MCFVIAGIDILLHEQSVFIERLEREIELEGEKRRLQAKVYVEGFHGWLESKLLIYSTFLFNRHRNLTEE